MPLHVGVVSVPFADGWLLADLSLMLFGMTALYVVQALNNVIRVIRATPPPPHCGFAKDVRGVTCISIGQGFPRCSSAVERI